MGTRRKKVANTGIYSQKLIFFIIGTPMPVHIYIKLCHCCSLCCLVSMDYTSEMIRYIGLG